MKAPTEKQVAFLTKLVNRNFKFADSQKAADEARAKLESGELSFYGASTWIDTMLAQATV